MIYKSLETGLLVGAASAHVYPTCIWALRLVSRRRINPIMLSCRQIEMCQRSTDLTANPCYSLEARGAVPRQIIITLYYLVYSRRGWDAVGSSVSTHRGKQYTTGIGDMRPTLL